MTLFLDRKTKSTWTEACTQYLGLAMPRADESSALGGSVWPDSSPGEQAAISFWLYGWALILLWAEGLAGRDEL